MIIYGGNRKRKHKHKTIQKKKDAKNTTSNTTKMKERVVANKSIHGILHLSAHRLQYKHGNKIVALQEEPNKKAESIMTRNKKDSSGFLACFYRSCR